MDRFWLRLEQRFRILELLQHRQQVPVLGTERADCLAAVRQKIADICNKNSMLVEFRVCPIYHRLIGSSAHRLIGSSAHRLIG
ncbi:hypothetical protein, partial [Cognatiyoonia sp. IB215182]|uniref:hypothetical protein n=1 Tax=Cognatiyoonia sp. IB215182 TaxID=3097353 RepID=UPI002A246FEA